MVNTNLPLSSAEHPPPMALIAASLPDEVAAHPLLDESAWLALRDSRLTPFVVTEMVTTLQARAEFLTGAWLLNRATKKLGGLLGNVEPQMLQVVDVLAAGYLMNGVIEPRRSSKTTTLFCVLMGRCFLREVHEAGFTLGTTQKKTAERYRRDIYGPIVRQWPDEDTRPVKLYKGNGTERVEFGNGSVLAALSPDGEAFRSGAYDTLLLDEGGEASLDMGADIKSAVLPAFDTREDGQFIVAGTAAKFRDGNVLWDMINNSKAGKLRYTVPDTTTDEELESWEPTETSPDGHVRELIEAMHPGVGGLTTLERIQNNYEELTIDQFSLEYLGLFGMVGSTVGLFDPVKWGLGGVDVDLPDPPERFRLAFAAHPNQSCLSIVAGWREDGKAVGLMVDWRTDIAWATNALLALSRKYEVPLTYDGGSQVAGLIVEQLNRAQTRPRLDPRMFVDVKKAASLVVDEVHRGNILHFNQPEFTSAAKVAVKRKAGVNGWALGRNPKSDEDDITGMEAWSLAMLAYDTEYVQTKRRGARVAA